MEGWRPSLPSDCAGILIRWPASSSRGQPAFMSLSPVLLALTLMIPAAAQVPAPAAPPPQRQPPAPSPQLLTDGRVTFRLLAPRATSVELAGDIYQGLPRNGSTLASPSSISMTKGPDGLWTGTSIAAFLPGAWRYHF